MFVLSSCSTCLVTSSVLTCFPSRNVTVFRPSLHVLHTLHSYNMTSHRTSAVLPVVLVVLALVTTVPCLSETARPPRYAVDTLTSRPALQRRWCPIESGIAIRSMLVAAYMRASPTTLLELTTLDCFRLSL